MAQDTQFRTDQFNEQARQASESRIARSVDQIGQSITHFGDSYRDQANRDRAAEMQQSQFDQTFALTKQKAAQDLYFQQRRDEELRTQSALNAVRKAKEIEEGELKLRLWSELHTAKSMKKQQDLTNKGIELDLAARAKAANLEERDGKWLEPKLDPTGGPDMSKLTSPVIWKDREGQHYTGDPRTKGRMKISGAHAKSIDMAAARMAQERKMRQMNVIADNLRMEIQNDMRGVLEGDDPPPHVQEKIQNLRAITERMMGGSGAPAKQRRKPMSTTERRNRRYEAAQKVPQFFEKEIGDLLSGKHADPQTSRAIADLKKNTKNGQEALVDLSVQMFKTQGVQEKIKQGLMTPSDVADRAIDMLVAGNEIPNLRRKDGKVPIVAKGVHLGKEFSRIYQGEALPSEPDPSYKLGNEHIVFSDDEAYYLLNTYLPKRKAGKILSERDAKSDSPLRSLVHDFMRNHPKRNEAKSKLKQVQAWLWESATVEERILYSGRELAIPKFEKYLQQRKNYGGGSKRALRQRAGIRSLRQKQQDRMKGK